MVRQIRRQCANFDRENGYCLPLDDICPQTLTLSLLCRYYPRRRPARRSGLGGRDPQDRPALSDLWSVVLSQGAQCKILPVLRRGAAPGAGSAAEKEEGKPFRFLKPGNPSISKASRAHNQGGALSGIPPCIFHGTNDLQGADANIPTYQKNTTQERLREITAQIEQGIRELFESDKYRQYLSVMSHFHRYSVNNTMLIFQQRPDATLVAGFQKWQNQFGRHVKKGEHGITIIAPDAL